MFPLVSVTRLAEWVLAILMGLAAVGAVFFRRLSVAAGPGGAGRGLFGGLAILCVLLFLWMLGGLILG